MELEELQAAWSEMSDQLNKQKKLTHKIIMEMAQDKYKRKFRKLTNYEGMGTLICFGMALLLIFNFGKLDTWYFVLLGSVALGFLLGLPLLVLEALNRIQSIKLSDVSYKDTLMAYDIARKWLLFVQRLSIYLSLIFVFVSLPLAGKLMKNRDFFQEGSSWLWFVLPMIAFLFLFSRWTYKGYEKATEQAEGLLRELEK